MQNLTHRKPLSLRFFFWPLLEPDETFCLCIFHDIYLILLCVIVICSFRIICLNFFNPCSLLEKKSNMLILMFWGFQKKGIIMAEVHIYRINKWGGNCTSFLSSNPSLRYCVNLQTAKIDKDAFFLKLRAKWYAFFLKLRVKWCFILKQKQATEMNYHDE